MIDLLREIWQTMRMNKVRTALTGIAVTWGVFMLIVLLGLARGVTNSFQSDMDSGSQAQIRIWSGMTSIPYKGNREGRKVSLDERDMKRIPACTPAFTGEVTSQLSGGGTLSTPKAKVSQAYTGVFPSEQRLQQIGGMSEGRFISDRDMAAKGKVMVLPRYYAEQLFPPSGEGALGGRVECQGLSFRVVGIYDSRWNRSVYIPFTTARMLAKDREDLGTLTVQLRNVSTEEDGLAAETGIRGSLAEAHGFDVKDGNAVYIANYFTSSLMMGKGMVILDTGVWVLGILTLLTGIVGVSNIMFVTVRERTHEIGIRRAIGARPRQILLQVVAEAVGLTLLFGYLGILAGMGVTQIIAAAFDGGFLLNPTVSLAIALEVTATLVVAGALAGLFPALKALKVRPVEALRYE